MNYKLELEYEGTRYNGWQRQDGTENTIQGKLENVLSRMAGEEIQVQGAGRTDAGVHARAQVANFHTEKEMKPDWIMDYVNRYLPEDIAVVSCRKVSERFHSRLNAKGKIYQYRIWNSKRPNVFERRWMYEYAGALDIEAMERASRLLKGTHDFQSFCSKKMKKSTVRTITGIHIETLGEEVRITYEGNGFLYHMVRILTGTLLEIGANQRAPEDIPLILQAEERAEAGELVPAKGLTLLKVLY